MNAVSICVPAYEEPEKLKRCLDSVLRQTYTNYEVIITDDSRDDAVEKVIEKEILNEKINYHRNLQALGSPENWNEAMRKASGEYIILMHHDDWFYTDDSLRILMECMLKGSVDLVFARSINFNENMVITSTNDPGMDVIRSLNADINNLFYTNTIGAPSAVLIKNRKIGYDKRLKWLVDIEFYIRYLGRGSLSYARDAIVAIGTGPTQVTRSCSGSLEIEVGENLLVYGMLNHRWRYFFFDLYHFGYMFRNFKLKSGELRRFKPSVRIWFFYFLYMLCSPLWILLRRVFRKAG